LCHRSQAARKRPARLTPETNSALHSQSCK
jgi:hypothetical protein